MPVSFSDVQARVRIREQVAAWARMKPISTGSPARSIGIPSSAITTRNCPTRRREIHFNSGQKRARSRKASGLGFSPREFLPDDLRPKSVIIFSRRGAYRRYKDLLVRAGPPSNGGTISRTSPRRRALREWCAGERDRTQRGHEGHAVAIYQRP